MELCLDVNNGWVYGATGKIIAGITIKRNANENVIIRLTNAPAVTEVDDLLITLVAKKNETILAYKEATISNSVSQFIFDLDTIEIRDAFESESEIETELEILVTNQSGSPVYLSQTIGVLIVKSLFADQILPHTARPNWEIQYDQICKIGTQVAEDSAIVLKTKEVVVAAEADVKTLADTASKAAGDAEQSRQVAHELATAANQSAQDADGFSKSAATTLNAVIEQRISVDLQSQSVSDNLGVVIAKTAEASQHASSSFTSAGEALDFRNQAQTLTVRAETAEEKTRRLKEEVVALKEVLDQLELRVLDLKQDAVEAATEAGESATTATQAKMASETARDQAQAYGEAVGVDSQGNLTVEGITITKQVLNAIGGVTCPKPTTRENAVNRDYVDSFGRFFDIPYVPTLKPSVGVTDFGGGSLRLNRWSTQRECFNFAHTVYAHWMGNYWYCNCATIIIPNSSALTNGRFHKYVICNRPLTTTIPSSITDNEQENDSLWGFYMHIIDNNTLSGIAYNSWDYYIKIVSPYGAVIEFNNNTGCLWSNGLLARRFGGLALVINYEQNRSAIYLVFEDVTTSRTSAIKVAEIADRLSLPSSSWYQKFHNAPGYTLGAFIQNPKFTIDATSIAYFDSITVRDLTI